MAIRLTLNYKFIYNYLIKANFSLKFFFFFRTI